MRLFYLLVKLAGKCFGQKLSRTRRFTLGGVAVRFHSFYDGPIAGGFHAVESISQSSLEL